MRGNSRCRESSLRTFVFVDLDGPILDTRWRHYCVYGSLARDAGGTALDLDSFWTMKRDRVPTDVLLQASNADMPASAFRARAMRRIESEEMLALDRIHPEALDALDRLRIGHRLVVVTMRRDASTLERQLRRTRIASHVDQVVQCAPGRRKDLALTAIADGVDGSSSHWVGDTEADIDAGRALGVMTWAVLCGIRSDMLLREAQPDHICESLSEVADRIAR